jgi:KaiC/GvpD/RAD55 family RecA-like ATPase
MPTSPGHLPDQPLPSNIEAERAVLGAILLDNSQFEPVAKVLRSSDFFIDDHRRIFLAITKLHELARPIDLITLTEMLQSTNELALAGGAGYVASLVDGVPRMSHAAAYAETVREKADLRSAIHSSMAVINRAMASHAKPEDLLLEVQQSMEHLTSRSNGRPHLVAVDLWTFINLNLRPTDWVIKEIFPTQGLGMLYAPRGTGKTYTILEIAYQIATGGPKLWGWEVAKERPVVLIDGEMQANRLQHRYTKLFRINRVPRKGFLKIITPDLQDPEFGEDEGFYGGKGSREAMNLFNIDTPAGQAAIEEHIDDGSFVIADNLSCLCRGGKENEGESWLPVLEWGLKLRRRGVSLLVIHHAGKSGDQRGSTRKEDALDVVIKLAKPADYQASQLLRAEVHCSKTRATEDANAVVPFEIQLENGDNGSAFWTYKPLREAFEERVLISLKDGMKVGEIASDLATDRFRIYRAIDKLIERGTLPPGYKAGRPIP